MRNIRQWNGRTIFASVVMGIGVLFLSLVAGYVYFDLRSGSDADQFDVSISPEDLPGYLERYAPPRDSELAETVFAALAGLYPGDRVNPKFWDTPQFAGSTPFGGSGIPVGFEPVDAWQDLGGMDPFANAVGMRIPAINLVSGVSPLQLLDLEDASAYQTPNNTVGFIPETSRPGSAGTGWYFGHLEGFVSGEGSVFRRVPEIARLIREDPVDIFLETADGEFMYRVTSTLQLPQEDLRLFDNGRNDVVLVTCWPTRIYDQRVVVTAELIAVRHASGTPG